MVISNFLISRMPEFGFPEFTVVVDPTSQRASAGPGIGVTRVLQQCRSPAQPAPTATPKRILTMFLPCQRLPTITKSSFANMHLNVLPR